MSTHLTADLSRSLWFLRKGHDWTQGDLAEKAGLSRRAIVRVENTPFRKNSHVTTRFINQVAKAAEISTGMLTMTPDVLSLLTGEETCPMPERKRRLEEWGKRGSFGLQSKAFVVIAQGGDAHRLFSSLLSSNDGE